MSEFTRPTAMISYATTVGVVASTIYLNNKINETSGKLHTKIVDITEDIGIIRDGVKEKVPMLENGLKHIASDMKNVIGAINAHSGSIKKLNKMEKKLSRCIMAVEDIMNALEVLEARQTNLINGLKAKGSLEGVAIEALPTPQPPVMPKAATKPKRNHRLVSSDDDSDSSSEDDRRKNKKKGKGKSKARDDTDNDDVDEVDFVARMASRK